MNSEIEVKKRDWVKNAAIAFLAGMLVLTFFSNTIMNRSLPEVAAQYTQSQAINSRIRGTGTVAANEIYEVMTSQAYTVSEVRARLGDEVASGDVLVILSHSDSSELEAAQEALRAAELDLEMFLIDSPDSTYTSYYRDIQNAKNALEEAKDRRDRADDVYDDAKDHLKWAEGELSKAKKDLSAVNFNESKYQSMQSAINAKEGEVQRLLEALKIAEENLDFYIKSKGGALAIDTDTDEEFKAFSATLINATKEHSDAMDALNSMKKDEDYLALQAAKDIYDAASGRVATAESAVSEARTETNAAKDNYINADSGVSAAEQAVDAANEALAQAQKSGGRENTRFDIQVREKRRVIDELEEKIAELEEEGSSTEITAPVGGKITAVNVSPGQQTSTDTPVMLIEQTDRGYTLSIPVTADQSSKVRVGDVAEVDRGWWSWGEALSATLTGIRPDPQNPAGGRLLVFTLAGGDVESGSQLNITINQRSENYGIVVPNSAIRSDTNGEFILIVETRSSPLRNRYIATRVDVTILASDDTNTAISGGGLSGWDYVITTSTRPIEPGMQVRLVDNP